MKESVFFFEINASLVAEIISHSKNKMYFLVSYAEMAVRGSAMCPGH